MTIDAKTIESLSDWLLADAQTGIDEVHRNLLVASLRELGVTTVLAAKQALLLASCNQDAEELERTLRQALDDAAGAANSPAPAAGYDFAKAKSARKELVAKVESAASLREIIDAGLTFAAHAAGLMI